MADRPLVLIIGAGIIGASLAWHLTRAGAKVTIVEAGEPGGIATRNSWAWINASWGNPEPYFRLRLKAMAEWRRLERDLPALEVAWTGGLIWDLPPDKLEAFAVQHASWGYGIRRVDRAEAQRIEPGLATPPEFALHVAGEGAVEPLAAARTLLTAAQELGATLMPNKRVRALDLRGGHVTGVETDAGRLEADEVVVAAGAETAALVAMTGLSLPLTNPPTLIMATKPHARLLNGLVIAPAMELRQTVEGRLLAAASPDDEDPADGGAAMAAELFVALKGLIRGGDALSPDFHLLGHRPIPKDRFPVVGRIDGVGGLYVAVTHSGITLAPAIGRFAADEILDGRRNALLEPFGSARFSPAGERGVAISPHGRNRDMDEADLDGQTLDEA